MSDNNLIWKNFSSFWNLVPPENKNIIEQTWEGLKEAIDDLYFQLYDIDNSKSLKSCPILTTRRWLMLDLSDKNLRNINDQGNALIERNKTSITSKVNLDNNIYNTERSILHKHFRFIYNTSNGTKIKLPFDLNYTTIEIYRYGKLIPALVSYNVDLDTNTINFKTSGEHIIYLSVDHTPGVANKFYEHKYIYQSSSDGNINLLNNVKSYTESFAINNNGYLLNPSQYTIVDSNNIKCNDLYGDFEIFWIEEEQENTFIERHDHSKYNVIFNSVDGKNGSVSSIKIPSIPFQSIKSRTEYILRIFVNGKMLDDDNFTITNNEISFSPILRYSSEEILKISVEWSNVYPSSNIRNHRHYAYQVTNFQSKFVDDVFDDGGYLDDGGVFDYKKEVAEITLPFKASYESNVSIWVGGVYLYKDIDYYIKDSLIVFNYSLNNKNVKISYYANDRIYVYGYENINYDQSIFSKVNLGLFYDETPEYFDKNINSPDASIPYSETTLINFENTYLKHIPIILDGIENWTVLYKQELNDSINDFEIDNGLIKSDVPLPEESWCPMVYFDELRLSQNFGHLIGLEKESSLRYKAELSNFFRSLWNGPTIQNIEWAASIFLGSDFIDKTLRIESVDTKLINKTLKTQFESFNIEDTELLPGDSIKAGQSTKYKINNSGYLSFNTTLSGKTLTHQDIGLYSEVNDILVIDRKQSFSIKDIIDSNTIELDRESLFDIGIVSTGSETLSIGFDSIGILVSGFSYGNLNDVTQDMFFRTNNVSYTITTQPAIDRIYLSITPSLGSTYSIYSEDEFYIYKDGGAPYFTENGTIVSLVSNIGNEITFSNGEVKTLSHKMPTYLKSGDIVEPFQPLSKLCSVIDNASHPEWWIDKTDGFRTSPTAKLCVLTKDLYPYERTIEVGSTEGFPDSGVIGIEGTNSSGFSTYERIFYYSKTSTKFINCIRGWSSVNKFQSQSMFNKGSFIQSELEYIKNTINHIGRLTFRDNVNNEDYSNMLDLVNIYSPNVMIISVSSNADISPQNLSVLNNFLNRTTESSVKWYLDININYEDTAIINPTEQVTIHELYSISPYASNINSGRVVSQIWMNTNGIFDGDLINSNDTYANVAKVDNGWVFVDYSTNNTFSIGDLVTIGSTATTITAVENYNILYFPGIVKLDWLDTFGVGTEYGDTASIGAEYGDEP